jgi:ligand-binding SRPBCC domain-containing protein
MLRIEFWVDIRASRELCFDLARDIDLHPHSMAGSGERAIAGRTSGLIELGEEVTWQARHFGLIHTHRARITAFERPAHFRDSMVAGRFKRFEHDHVFDEVAGLTRMRDILDFESPCGPLGRLVDRFVLSGYLSRLLRRRGAVIKAEAEAAVSAAPEKRR